MNSYLQFAKAIKAVFPSIGSIKIVHERPAVASPPATVLTPPEVAKQLRCRASQVLAWIRSGELKASNLSKGSRPRYRVTPDDLAAFLKSRQPEAPKGRAARRTKPSRF